MRFDFKRVLRVLGSRELAATTMVAWAALVVVWVIPFQFYGLPTPQIKNIVYSESFFRIVYGMLAVNTLACIVPRIPAVVRRVRVRSSTSARPRIPEDAARLEGEWDAARAERSLAVAGFRHLVVGDGWVWGVRNRYAPLGHLVFHLAFFLVIAGALLTLDPRATYLGKAVVAEGESFNTATGTFAEEPTPREVRPAVSFSLTDLRPVFYEDVLLFTGLDGEVVSNGRTHPIALSSPWLQSPTTQVAIEDFGYVLDTTWTVKDVGDIRKAYKLKVFPSGIADSFVLNQGGKIDYEATVRVYGDYVDRSGAPGSKSFNLSNPRLLVDVSRMLSSGGRQPIVRGALVAPGDPIELPDSVLVIEEIDHYGVFRIFDSWAAPVIFLGIVTLLAGTVMRLLFPRQDVLVFSGDGGVGVSVRDEAYRVAPAALHRVTTAWGDA